MLRNTKICRIAAYGAHFTYCSEPSNTNALWNIIELQYIEDRICIQQNIFKIPAERIFFMLLKSLMCYLLPCFQYTYNSRYRNKLVVRDTDPYSMQKILRGLTEISRYRVRRQISRAVLMCSLLV